MLQAVPEVLIYQKVAVKSSSLLSAGPQLLLYPVAYNPKPKRNKVFDKELSDFEMLFEALSIKTLFDVSYALRQVSYPWTAGEAPLEVAAQSFLFTHRRR